MAMREEVKDLRTLFKYCSGSPQVVTSLFRDHKIRFTQPAALNDPLEFNPCVRFDTVTGDQYKPFLCNGVTMPSIHGWHTLNLIESRINKFGVLSLTENPYSFEMWSHYADGHRGFLIEFNVPDKKKPWLELCKGKTFRVHRVKYVKDYLINLDQLAKGKSTIPNYKIRDAVFLRKTKHWKYEREYRVIRELADCEMYEPPTRRTSYRDDKVYLFPLSLDCISSIVFGVNTPQDTKREIIELCKGSDIAFLQTTIYKDQGNKINFISVDQFGSNAAFLALLPQVFTTDSIYMEYRNSPIQVDSLTNLPYYRECPHEWQAYYDKQVERNTV